MNLLNTLLLALFLTSFANAEDLRAKIEKCPTCLKLEKAEERLDKIDQQRIAEVKKIIPLLEDLIRTDSLREKEIKIRILVGIIGRVLDSDPHHLTIETVYPYYKEHKKAFEAEINNLPIEQAKRFREGLEATRVQTEEGNG